MAKFESFYIENGPLRDQVVYDIGTMLSLRLIDLGQDGNMPDHGAPARPLHPLNPSHHGEVSAVTPEQAVA